MIHVTQIEVKSYFKMPLFNNAKIYNIFCTFAA